MRLLSDANPSVSEVFVAWLRTTSMTSSAKAARSVDAHNRRGLPRSQRLEAATTLGNHGRRDAPNTLMSSMSRRDGGIDLSDRLPSPQVAGMSCYSADEEITPICADFLVELRGSGPLTSGVERPL
jgi:hypothetical protein